MKYGLISDVHGNVDALRRVVALLEKDEPDRFVCMGDVVGYGGCPQECCETVRSLTHAATLGNHDAAVTGRMDYSYYYDAARNALDMHASWLSPENMAWLRSLPYRWDDRENDITFSHGSPVRPEDFEYVFAIEQARGLLPHWEMLSHVTFIGHSHLTKSFSLTQDRAQDVTADVIQLEPDKKYIITVGSVGQPRDYDSRSCGGIYDTETDCFEFRRAIYEVHSAADRILSKGMSHSFAKRLFLGV